MKAYIETEELWPIYQITEQHKYTEEIILTKAEYVFVEDCAMRFKQSQELLATKLKEVREKNANGKY